MPSAVEPQQPSALYQRVATVYAQQSAMQTMGVTLLRVEPGKVALGFPFNPDFCQHDRFLHAGAVTTVVDSACGGAAYTMITAGQRALTIEFKVNLLAPAVGDHFLAVGQVVRSGRSLVVCQGEVFAATADYAPLKQIALMQTTLMILEA